MTSLEKIMRRISTTRGESPAIIQDSTVWSYGQLDREVARLHQHLAAVDEPVMLEMGPRPDTIATFLALARGGSDILPLEPAEIQAGAAQRLFKAGVCSKVVLPPGASDRSRERLRSDALPVLDLPTGERVPQTASFVDCGPASEMRLLQLTSGTTGPQKIVVHPESNLLAGASAYASMWSLRPSHRIVLTVPIALSYGLIGGVLSAILAGAAVVLVQHRPPRSIWAEIDNPDTRLLLATPALYRTLLGCGPERPKVAPTTVFLSSGAPLDDDVAATFARRTGVPIRQVYGCTEAGVIAAGGQHAAEPRIGYIGSAAPGVELRIRHDAGRDLPAGQEGRIWIRSPTLFAGYAADGGVIAPELEDGFYSTNDVGSVDVDGLLRVTGRSSDFLNVQGRKVSPHEVEGVLRSHPAVLESLAYAVTVRGRERVQADVVARAPVELEELLSFCRGHLAPHKVPYLIRRVASLPKTINGKLRRLATTDGTAT